MKKFLSALVGLILMISTNVNSQELKIEKQLVGIVGAISGTVKTETRQLKAGDKIYLNETIVAGAGSGTQILLLDQSTFTIGEDSEVVMDTFIFDPWVRCPPDSSDKLTIVSPGFNNPKNTDWLACDPECGCTLANFAENSFFSLSIARSFISSTNLQPP